jgi:proteasome-associated ATPase
MNPDQRNAERIVNSMLVQLKTKPDTGVVRLIQMLQPQSELVRNTLIEKLASHYSRSNEERLRRLEQELKKLKQPPLKLGMLESSRIDELGNRVALVCSGSDTSEVMVSGDVTANELIPGIRVVLSQSGGAVIGTRGLPPASPAAEFERLLSDNRLLLTLGNEKLVVQRGGKFLHLENFEKLKPGDLIEYEPSIRHALRTALHSVKTAEFVGEVPDVDWSDIGGLDEIRESIDKEVLGPLIHKKIYDSYGVQPPRGIIFDGPPGVGKTMLIKAMGKSLVSKLGLDLDSPILFQVKGSAFLSPYVGEGPARIRALSARAREAAEESGLAVIFLDDFEYGGGLHRGIGDASSPAYSNLTAALISEMEGLDKKSRIVWAATANRIDLVDSALLRPGRFSKKITVPRPSPQACIAILTVHLKKKPLVDNQSPEELAEKIVEQIFIYDDEHLLLRIHFSDGGLDEIFPSRIISGAALAEAVRCAGLKAIDHDLSEKIKKPTGITFENLSEAINEQLAVIAKTIQPSNAHLHYLDIPANRRVTAVEHVFMNRY